MVFKTPDVADHPAYLEKFKKELLKLKNDAGELKEFWFYDDVDLGGTTGPVLLFSEVQDSVLRALKGKAKARANGSCFLEGDTLKITLTKGKMPSPKVKPLFQGIPFKFKMVGADVAEVEGDDSETSEAETAFFGALNPATDLYDSIRAKLPDNLVQQADDALAKISALATQGKFEEAIKPVREFQRSLDDLREAASEGIGTDTAEMKKQRDALAQRFEAFKGNITSEARAALRERIVAFDDAFDNSLDPATIRKALFDLKAAVEASERDSVTPRMKLEAAAKTVIGQVAKEQGNMTPEDLKRVRGLVDEFKSVFSKGDQKESTRVLGLLQATLKDILSDPNARSIDGGDGAAAQRNLREVVNAFDKIKGQIDDEARKQLRVAFGRATDDIKAGKFAEADEVVRAIARRLQALQKALTEGTAQQAEDVISDAAARQLVLLKRRAGEVRKRFAKARARMEDSVASGLEVRIAKVVKDLGASQLGDCAKRLDDIEAEMRSTAKATLKSAEEAEQLAEKALENSATTDEKDLGAEIRSLSEDLETAFGEAERLSAAVSLIRRELADPTLSGPAAMPLLVELQDLTDDLDQAQKDLASHRKALNEKIAELKALQLQNHPALVQTMKAAHARFVAAEEALGGISTTEARSELEDLVGQMALATEWREEQLKGGGHGTSRHGAQTGLERQARRAATPSSVTPEQSDNPGGAAMILDWNKVQITYKEVDGKRVVDQRKVVASKVAGTLTNGGPNTTKGSMWATPVLEKLAYDTALAYANKMKDYTQYIKGNGQRKDFTKFTCFIKAPGGQPGWGFSVNNTGAPVSESDAEAILREFEEGKLTHDQMFVKFNSELSGKGGSAEYIKFATVCFKRGNGGDDWDLLTMFPNENISAEAWECQKNWRPNNLKFDKGAGVDEISLPNTTMPS